MAKTTTIQTNFNAGELSPNLGGHIDLDRYANGVKEARNTVLQVEGGGQRRPGLRQIAAAKYPDRTTRLIPFVFSKDQAYVIELGDGYARFYEPSGQIVSGSDPIEITTPWPQTEVFNVEFAQRSDTMFMANGGFAIKRLVRVLQTAWTIGDAPFDPGPIDEIGTRPAATLNLSALLVGTPGIATAAGAFIPSDVGRNIIAGSGQAEIGSYIDSSNVSYTVTSTFGANAVAANAWKLDQSPRVAITPSISTPVDGDIALTADGVPIGVQTLSLSAGVMTVTTVTNHGLVTGQQIAMSGFESAGLDGLYYLSGTPAANVFTFAFSGTLLTGGTFGSVYPYGTGQAWRLTDVGSYVSINGGLVQINGVDGGLAKAFGKIIRELTATVTAPPDSWSLMSPVWNPVDGYPRAVSLYQQRLYAAGSSNYPENIWASGTGLYFDFTPGTDDSDSFSYAADSDQVNQVAHLASSRVLAVLTQGEEFVVTAGTASSITPTNIDVSSQSIYGCSPARPVRVANELIYLQRAGKKVRAMNYDFNTDSFPSANLTRLASHITGPGVIDMTFQAEPNPVVWMVRSDGVLVSMTYDSSDGVCGFAQHTTDGLFKSVCAIPGSDGDIVFVLVQRTINGQTVQNVEQFDPTVMTDAAIVGTSAGGSSVWTGLSTLEGKTVDVKGDGTYLGTFTVAGGQITIPRSAKSIEIGLHYDNWLLTLTPNLGGGGVTSQGNQATTSKVTVRVLDTINLLVDGQRVAFVQLGADVLDKPPTPFTGDKDITDLGWDTISQIELRQDQPYAWYVLAMIRQFSVNSG